MGGSLRDSNPSKGFLLNIYKSESILFFKGVYFYVINNCFLLKLSCLYLISEINRKTSMSYQLKVLFVSILVIILDYI